MSSAPSKKRAQPLKNNSATFKTLSDYIKNTDGKDGAEVVGAVRKAMKGRRLREFAPALAHQQQHDEQADGDDATTPAVTSTSALSDTPSVPNVKSIDRQVHLVARACGLAEAASGEAGRVVSTMVDTAVRQSASGRGSTIVRRIVSKNKKERTAGAVIGVCEMAARIGSRADTAVLVLEPTDGDAAHTARLFRQMGVPALHLECDTAADKVINHLSGQAAPVLVPARQLKRDPILNMAAAASGQGTAVGPAEGASFMLKTCPHVCVATISSVIARAKVHFCRQFACIIVNDPQTREEEMYDTAARLFSQLRVAFVLAPSPELAVHQCTAGFSRELEAGARDASDLTELPLAYITAEGTARFEALLVLLRNSAANNKVVIQAATAESAVFLTDMLFALNVPTSYDFTLLCDSETQEGSAALRQEAAAALAQFEAAKSGTVLITACGLLPPSGTILVQYDPTPSIDFLCSTLLRPIAASLAAFHTYQQDVVVPAAESGAASVPAFAPPGGDAYAYRHFILFLYANDETGVLTLVRNALRQGVIGWDVRPERVPPVSASTAGDARLLVMKMKQLHKRVFALQHKAYEAYRSLMQVYVRLHPRAVFNVDELNLQGVCEQFGYEELPLLDLRTKATQFRPRADTFKAAAIKSKKAMKRVREHADANIIGAGPDTEWMADCPPSDHDDE